MASYKFIFFVLLISSYNSVRTMASYPAANIIDQNGNFSNKLYKILASGDDNVLYSPFSLHSILGLAYQGAAGDTAKIFEKVLSFTSDLAVAEGYKNLLVEMNTSRVILNMGNKVFVQKPYVLKKKFSWITENQFFAEAEDVDFIQTAAATDLINEWAKRKTEGKIENLANAEEFTTLTRLVLVNVLYFLGTWKYQFNETLTRKIEFYVSGKDTESCDVMNIMKTFDYKSDKFFDADIVSLPYKNEKLSLTIVLPKSKTGLKDLEKKLETHKLTDVIQNLSKVPVELFLPRIKMHAILELQKPLTELGLGDIFGESANFSKIADTQEPLHVSKVLQSVLLEVNESGTEAAGSTDDEIETEDKSKITFNANHPFIYTITYNHEGNLLPLFVGRYSKPN